MVIIRKAPSFDLNSSNIKNLRLILEQPYSLLVSVIFHLHYTSGTGSLTYPSILSSYPFLSFGYYDMIFYYVVFHIIDIIQDLNIFVEFIRNFHLITIRWFQLIFKYNWYKSKDQSLCVLYFCIYEVFTLCLSHTVCISLMLTWRYFSY